MAATDIYLCIVQPQTSCIHSKIMPRMHIDSAARKPSASAHPRIFFKHSHNCNHSSDLESSHPGSKKNAGAQHLDRLRDGIPMEISGKGSPLKSGQGVQNFRDHLSKQGLIGRDMQAYLNAYGGSENITAVVRNCVCMHAVQCPIWGEPVDLQYWVSQV